MSALLPSLQPLLLLEQARSDVHQTDISPGNPARSLSGKSRRGNGQPELVQPLQKSRLEVRGSVQSSTTDSDYLRSEHVQENSDERLQPLREQRLHVDHARVHLQASVRSGGSGLEGDEDEVDADLHLGEDEEYVPSDETVR